MARIPAVPYCTVKGFRACLDLLKREGLETLDRDLLIQRGFSPHAAYPVLGALRFLGLLDDQGRVLPTIESFMGDDVPGRRRLVEAAYHDLLPDIVMPVDERETVDRLLIEKHGVAPGVAPFCATFLLWVAAESGLPVADIARSRRGRPPAHLVQLSPSARAAMESAAHSRRHDGLDVPAAALAAGTHLPPEVPVLERDASSLKTSVE
jgi:hypothetical protein